VVKKNAALHHNTWLYSLAILERLNASQSSGRNQNFDHPQKAGLLNERIYHVD
jgi:hypothetical protein